MILLFAVPLLINRDFSKLTAKRNNSLISNYPNFISKLCLLVGAGMTIKSALRKILSDNSYSSKEYLYINLKNCLTQIDNGTYEGIAYRNFGLETNIPCYIKLGALLEQNLVKGNKELISILSYEATASLIEKKQLILKKSEEASTKLLLPMMLLFLLILIMVMLPALLNINL